MCVMQTVSGKLARHVSKKRDKLLEGIDLVAGVEESIKIAYMTARSSRSTMRTAGEEVARNLRVAGHTRRKQVSQHGMQYTTHIHALLALLAQCIELQ